MISFLHLCKRLFKPLLSTGAADLHAPHPHLHTCPRRILRGQIHIEDGSDAAGQILQYRQLCEMINHLPVKLILHREYLLKQPVLQRQVPVKLLNSLGMFDYGGGGYHCVWMDEEDMDIFAERGLSVVTNPGSNTKLASGIAPISAYLKRGVNVAVGTDGSASNNCLDMFREMFLVTGLAKLREQDAAAVDVRGSSSFLHSACCRCIPDFSQYC